MASVHTDALLGGIAQLVEFSDLTINCDGRQWGVHKAIMCSASEVLMKECLANMQEGNNGAITHKEFDAKTMDRMISYIYKRTYDVAGEEELLDATEAGKSETETVEQENDDSTDDDSGNGKKEAKLENINHILAAHVSVYGIADFYQIPTLKIYAAERFESVGKRGLRQPGFVDVVKAVYERTSDGDTMLRSRLRDYAAVHRKVLLHHPGDFTRSLGEPSPSQDLAIKMLQHSLDQTEQELLVKEITINNLNTSADQAEELKQNLLEDIKGFAFKTHCGDCEEQRKIKVLPDDDGKQWIFECSDCGSDLYHP